MPDAMLEVMRHRLAQGWSNRSRYVFAWSLVRTGQAAQALFELQAIDRAALDGTAVANCYILEGRASLQLSQEIIAIECFKLAVAKIRTTPRVDFDVYANARLGHGIALTALGKYLQAERVLVNACRLSMKASEATRMKVYHAMAALARARGHHFEAFAYLLHRHKIALGASRDVVLHAETLVEPCRGK